MLASDVWIEQLLSHEDACNSVDPLSSEDVAVVVDFNWFNKNIGGHLTPLHRSSDLQTHPTL